MLSELFRNDIRTINEHIKNIFEGGELEPAATIRKFRIVQTARIDTLIEKIQIYINLLCEYRTALISSAVTGKIDVQKEVA